MPVVKTGVINRKDGKSTLNFTCSCGRVHRATATLGQVSCGAYSQPTVDIAVEELALHLSAEGSEEGEAGKIADAVRQAGAPEGPKWIPKLIHAEAWSVGYYESDAWEGDGPPSTYAEALQRARWLNEQEQLADEERVGNMRDF